MGTNGTGSLILTFKIGAGLPKCILGTGTPPAEGVLGFNLILNNENAESVSLQSTFSGPLTLTIGGEPIQALVLQGTLRRQTLQ